MSKLHMIMIQICNECLTGRMTTVRPLIKPEGDSHKYLQNAAHYRAQCRQQGCFYFLQKPPDFYIAPEMYDPAILRTESPLGRLFEVMD